jgi:hypothetical protein
MQIGDIVRFQKQRFFNGAVQLGWVQNRPPLATEAARAFVFHGPRYHGAGDGDASGIEHAYRLKDTAGFMHDLLAAMSGAAAGAEVNPYWLAVAGYGSGKSHLAVTVSELLSDPQGETARAVLAQVTAADAEIGAALGKLLAGLDKPVLVIPLDGLGIKRLRGALSQAVFARLEQAGVDAEPIRALSPRFQTAEQFVERNFDFRSDVFGEVLPGQDGATICERLRAQDEAVFDAVDAVYSRANGHPIPIEGQESAQELISTLCRSYCGDAGPFSHLLLLFDELGLYLGHAAEHAGRAGASVLQELFQGVQDNSDKAQFVGFIQYELKAYLKRFGSADQRDLQRFVTRFDVAEKWYLSTNLETLFAHMLSKDETALDALWRQADADSQAEHTWQRLAPTLPGFDRFPTWADRQQFARIIHRGCWPLHPLTVWFLTRQQGLVQERSALAFVNDVTERLKTEPAYDGAGLRQISAAQLVLDYMLPELLAAERAIGSGAAETLQGILQRFAADLDRPQRLVLAGIAVIEKTRVGKQPQAVADALLAEAAGLSGEPLSGALDVLANRLGALGWNPDLGRYELIADGVSRVEFEQWLRGKRRLIDADGLRQLFVRRGVVDCGLDAVQPSFAKEHDIRTPDWQFEPRPAHAGIVKNLIVKAADEWRAATLADEAKGKLIYLYLHEDDDAAVVEAQVGTHLAAQVKRLGLRHAPIWVAMIEDREGRIGEHLARMEIIDGIATDAERERFGRFLADEQLRSREALVQTVNNALREPRFLVAGFAEPPSDRLRQSAKRIFEQVYPEVLPFPFDGFTTRNGGGAKDAVLVAKALLGGQVTLPWIQLQPAKLKNRVDAVLMQSWQALSPSSGEPREPEHPELKALLARLQQAHQNDPARTLLTSYREVIAPPYGLNASSAAVLLGLLLALRDPQRVVVVGDEQLTPAQWLEQAFVTRPGRHQLDEAALAAATLCFFDADSETRWQAFIDQWSATEALQEQVKLSKEARQWREREPVPPSLAVDYQRLSSEADQAARRLLEAQHEINQWLEEIEQAVRRESVHHALRYGAAALHRQQSMSESGLWPRAMMDDCERIIEFAREVIEPGIERFTLTQNCGSAQQIAAFREAMERETGWLKDLGYCAEANRHEAQGRHVINGVTLRAQWQNTLARCQDYPRQPTPRASTPIQELTDEIKRGDELLEVLATIPATVLSDAEKQAHRGSLSTRQGVLKQAIEERNAALTALDDLRILNAEMLAEARAEVERVRMLFLGRRDEVQINDIAKLLDRIKADMAAWDAGAVSVERLSELLTGQLTHQLGDLRIWLEQMDIEPPMQWDLETIYRALAAEQVDGARRRSTDWLRPRLLDDDAIAQMDQARCDALVQELADAPGYLADADSGVVARQLAALRQRQATLAEQARAAKVAAWRAQLAPAEQPAALDRAGTEALLKTLENPPSPLAPDEASWQRAVVAGLTARLDELSLDDLLERIARLSRELRGQLLHRLQELV